MRGKVGMGASERQNGVRPCAGMTIAQPCYRRDLPQTEVVTMPNLRWTDDGKRSATVCERDFTVERRGEAIPGVVWQPLKVTGARPLVLMGHGGSGHKRSAKM